MRTLVIVLILSCLALLGCGPVATHGKSKTETTKPNADEAGAALSPTAEHNPSKLKNSLGMELVFIKPGSFMMGGEKTPEEVARLLDGKVEWYNDERPQHLVTLSKENRGQAKFSSASEQTGLPAVQKPSKTSCLSPVFLRFSCPRFSPGFPVPGFPPVFLSPVFPSNIGFRVCFEPE